MPFKDLALAPVRERTGPRAGAGFTFQKNWSICRLLERHEQGEDYVVAFDYQDDMVVIDAPESDSKIHFFQVKAKSGGNWTLPALLKRAKKKKKNEEDASILGKMYDNKLRWPANTASLNFVTNASFSVELADKSGGASTERETIQLSQLAEESRRQIRERVKAEHGLAEEPEFDTLGFLHVTDLSAKDSSGHTLGKVEEFLSRRSPNRKRLSKPFYQTLFSEVTRRSDYAVPVEHYEDLLKHKALTRDQIEGFAKVAGTDVDLDALWTRVSQRLDSEAMAVARVMSIRAEWVKHEVQRLDVRNDTLSNLTAVIRAAVTEAQDAGITTLTAFVDQINGNVRVGIARGILFTLAQVSAIALMELYERTELQTTSTESPEENR
jgi:hypothetical protein